MTNTAAGREQPAGSPPRADFISYLLSSSLWTAGLTLQTFLFTALLVVVLNRPAEQTGIARMLADLPPLLVLLLGGWLGDRTDQRRTLLWMHGLVALPPLAILAVWRLDALSYVWVITFGTVMMSLQALSDPTRQAVLSRVAAIDIQRAVTLLTVTTSLIGLAGLLVGSQLERWGLGTVLIIQSALFATGALAVLRLPPMPPTAAAPTPQQGARRLALFVDGFRACWQSAMIRNLISLNFLSSLFNAGAYIIAVPYIITDIYGGTAQTLATAMLVFTIGSIISNIILFRVMPLLRPGRLFLLMQLTRVAILGALLTQPSLPLFYALLVAWGLNMGVTTTMVRTTVQELAPAQSRTQILSVLLLSFMVSSPISAILLGFLIAGADPLLALAPAVAISFVIFLLGTSRTGLWRYEAHSAKASANDLQ
ncbi:MAG: hypothetical protein AAGG11_11345 [Pseudomonadota bacterium]